MCTVRLALFSLVSLVGHTCFRHIPYIATAVLVETVWNVNVNAKSHDSINMGYNIRCTLTG